MGAFPRRLRNDAGLLSAGQFHARVDGLLDVVLGGRTGVCPVLSLHPTMARAAAMVYSRDGGGVDGVESVEEAWRGEGESTVVVVDRQLFYGGGLFVSEVGWLGADDGAERRGKGETGREGEEMMVRF